MKALSKPFVVLLIIIASIFVSQLSFVGSVQAQSADSAERNAQLCVENGGTWDGNTGVCARTNSGPCEAGGSILGLPTWYKYLETTTDASGKCRPTIENSADALPIGVAVLEIMLRLAGIVAVAFITIGAFKYIVSQGEPDAIKSAKGTILNAIIGLIITIIATGIVSFIGNNIGAS